MKFVLFLLSLLIVMPVHAQTETPAPHPLLQLLALVPDNDATSLVYYSDMLAAREARPAAGVYESWAEFAAAREGSEEEELASRLWINTFPATGAYSLARYMMQAGDFLEVMGFDVFDINRALSFGDPPAQVQIFEGDFDPAFITAARTANGFETTEIGEFPAWCSAEGCDMGMKQNLQTRNVADVFGGDLGRKQPIVLIESYLFSSSSLEAVETVTAAYHDESESLADNPAYAAAVEALTQDVLLREALFVPPDAVGQVEDSPLPAYELAVIADSASGDEQTAVIALVYANADDAQTAAEIIPAQLEAAESVVTQRAWRDLIADSGAALQDPTIYESENGTAVLVLNFTYPAPSDEPDEDGRVVMTGILYRRFLNALYARDLFWLAGK